MELLQEMLMNLSAEEFQELDIETIPIFFPVVERNLCNPNTNQCNASLIFLDEGASNIFFIFFSLAWTAAVELEDLIIVFVK